MVGEAQNLSSGQSDREARIRALIGSMTLEEKVGQLNQVQAVTADPVAELADAIRAGRIGSVINLVDADVVAELQRIAVEESRLGIPLLIGRDVIHGFKTMMPLPLAQAASWNPDLVQECARISAQEAVVHGVNWSFAPMLDISRDPRWGRVAESFGEDPYLTSLMGAAMVAGLQTDNPDQADTLLACGKHFAGYGACEGGRDYAATDIPPNEFRNVHLRPFKAAVDAGVATLMTSFSDVDGIPATGNSWLLSDVLRHDWQFDGLVVSDWDSIRQLTDHGLCEDDRHAALTAAEAGVEMDMVGGVYETHLPALCAEGELAEERIDTLVANVLRVKVQGGLIDGDRLSQPVEEPARLAALSVAKQAAIESLVLLRNEHQTLPLDLAGLNQIAVLGPMADEPGDQMGTWAFDGEADRSVTPLQAIEALVGDEAQIHYSPVLHSSRGREHDGFDAAFAAAQAADIVLLFLGEESILSGEAHSRADISLPGAQSDLVKLIRSAGKPVVGVILAGRPLALENVLHDFDALVYAWHGGSMAGPAIADVIFGRAEPVGKLPITLPKVSGQVPIYYAHKNTGRPPSPELVIHIDDIEKGAPQTSLGMTSFYLDAGYQPLFPFGFGLGYTHYSYDHIELHTPHVAMGEPVRVSAVVRNEGGCSGTEIAQLYIRDRVASVTRPVRELKAFQRVRLEPGEARTVTFELTAEDLSFYGRDGKLTLEPGKFDIWIGGHSGAQLGAELSVHRASPG